MKKIDLQFILWIVKMSPYQKAMDLPNKNIAMLQWMSPKKNQVVLRGNSSEYFRTFEVGELPFCCPDWEKYGLLNKVDVSENSGFFSPTIIHLKNKGFCLFSQSILGVFPLFVGWKHPLAPTVWPAQFLISIKNSGVTVFLLAVSELCNRGGGFQDQTRKL